MFHAVCLFSTTLMFSRLFNINRLHPQGKGKDIYFELLAHVYPSHIHIQSFYESLTFLDKWDNTFSEYKESQFTRG